MNSYYNDLIIARRNANCCIILLLSLLQFMIYPCLSQTPTPTPTPAPEPTGSPTTTEENNGEGQYTSIYITMIIIFSILFIVVIFCLIYRIYKKRQEENNTSSTNKQSSKNDKNKKQENGTIEQQGDDGNYNEEIVPQEQVKFRGSMSSVENRHERVPSKPVIIAITTPKGTRHVADAFGEYDGKDPENVKDELPGIDEDEEEDYGDDQQYNNNNNNNTQNNTTNTATTDNEKIIDIEDDGTGTEDIDISTPPINDMKHIKDKDKDRSFDSTESIEDNNNNNTMQ